MDATSFTDARLAAGALVPAVFVPGAWGAATV
jgi:hypothetical protein